MKKRQNNSARAWALQITFSVALLFASAIWLAVGAPTNPKEAFGPGRLGVHAQEIAATPTLGNYPDTSLPLSTNTTVTPDAAPTNTTSVNVSTSTDFNGTLEGDPATGVVRVTDAHPAGTYTVMVTAFDSGGATAIKSFTLTVTTPATCTPVSFAAAANFPTVSAYSVAVGDFNGDGNQDLAVGHGDLSAYVSILLGDGAGNFSAPTNFPVGGSQPLSIAVGDFDGDGNQDLAVATTFSDPPTVSILLGNGDGTFSGPTNFPTGGFGPPEAVVVGDFDGDGNQDLAAVLQAGSVSILLGDGMGNFAAPTLFSAGAQSFSGAVGDFNGDGNQDLAVTSRNPYGVAILLGDGAGNFSAPTIFPAGDDPISVAVGDFNGDGKQDLAVVNGGFSDPPNVALLLGDGAGNFSAPTFFAAGDGPFSVAVGDFSGDGKPDLAVANFTAPGRVSILLGDGTGNLSAGPTLFSGGNNTNSVAVGDFNGDGKQDLAAANGLSDNVSIFLRNCGASQITPAGTSCSQFSSGTAETLGIVQYDLAHGLIHRVFPRSFLYWVKVTAPSGDNTFRITQTITTGNFNTFFAGTGGGSNVFDSNCVSLERTGRQSGDTVTVRFSAPTAGTYFIAIAFDARNLVGEPAPNPTTVHYEFTTTGVPDSTSGLDLVEQ